MKTINNPDCIMVRQYFRHRFVALALSVSCILGLEASPATAICQEKTAGWVSLFNGKDLTGWTPKIKGYELGNNFGETFRVEDGVIKVSYDQYQQFDRKFGHLFYKDKFSHYRIRIEYRFLGEQCPGGEG